MRFFDELFGHAVDRSLRSLADPPQRDRQEGDLESFAWSNPGWLSVGAIVACGLLALPTLLGPEDALGWRLFAWGAKDNEQIANGEWWRLVSSSFLHTGWEHLLFNAYALFVAGSLVEHAYGPARFAVIYLGAAVAGSFASYALLDSLSVGASGAIFGLMGAGLLSLWRGHQRIRSLLSSRHLWALAGWVGYSLLAGFADPTVDNAGHVGGLLAGLGLAAVLPSGPVARGAALAVAATLSWTALEVAGATPRYLAYARAEAAEEQGDLGGARREYAAALPYPPARFSLAVTSLRAGDVAVALAHFDTLLASGPRGETLALAHLNRGIALDHLGRHEEALTAAVEAEKSSDTDTRQRAQLMRGRALVRLGRHTEALPAIDSAAASADSAVAGGAEFLRGDALGELRRHSEAAHAYRASARISPDPAAWYNAYVEHSMAREARAARGALDTALAAAQLAVQRSGERDPEALGVLATILEALGRDREAAAARRKAEALEKP